MVGVKKVNINLKIILLTPMWFLAPHCLQTLDTIHKWKFVSTCVCEVTFKHLDQPLQTHIKIVGSQ